MPSELLQYILAHEEAFKSRNRLLSLYSDFSHQASTNPDNYRANIAAWQSALSNAATAGVLPGQSGTGLCVMTTGNDLVEALERDGAGGTVRPSGLGPVVADAIARKEMIPLSDFLAAKTSIYSRSWYISPWAIITWGLRQLGVMNSQVDDSRLAVGSFVVKSNVEAAAAAILSTLKSTSTSRTSLVHSLSTFTSAFRHALSSTQLLSPLDVRIILTHLSRDNPRLLYDTKTQTIKFAPTSSASPPEPITDTDVTTARLKTLIADLEPQIPSLEHRLDTAGARAREAVKAGKKPSALAALKEKKLVQGILDQRTATLHQLQQVFAKIEEAADQVEVVRVMQSSAVALKQLRKEVGGVERVQDVMESLQEEMANVDDISRIVNEPGTSGVQVDDGEIDDELEQLEKAQVEEKEARQRQEMEEMEKAQAERTRERLKVLEAFEKERGEKETAAAAAAAAAKKAEEEQQTAGPADESAIEEETKELRKMSLEESREGVNEEQNQRQPVHA